MEATGRERQVTGTAHDGDYAAEARVQFEIATQCLFHGGLVFGAGRGFTGGDVEIHLGAAGFGGRNRQTGDGRGLLIILIVGIGGSDGRLLGTRWAWNEEEEGRGADQNQPIFSSGHEYSTWTTDFLWAAARGETS